jgi:hypothetical protein
MQPAVDQVFSLDCMVHHFLGSVHGEDEQTTRRKCITSKIARSNGLEITPIYTTEFFSNPVAEWVKHLTVEWEAGVQSLPCVFFFFSSATFYGKKTRSKVGSDHSK